MKILRHNVASLLLVSVLVVSIFALFFSAGISYKQIQSVNNSGKRVMHSYKVNLELEKLNTFVKDAETNQRGYILTKDSSFLELYHIAVERTKQSFNELDFLTIDNSEQRKTLDSLHNLILRRFYFLESVLKNNSNNTYVTDSLKNLLLKGKLMMIKANEQVDRMVSNELKLLKTLEVDHEKDINLSPLSILLIVLLSLSVFILAYSKINSDLKRLTKKNNQLLINTEIFEHSEQIADISNWCWNIDTQKVTYSNNQYRLLGCEPKEFDPTLRNFLKYVHPDDRHLLIEGSRRAAEELETSVIYFRVIRKDGALRYFKSIGKVITDSFGKILIIGVNADITDQYNKNKLIEEKLVDLEKSNHELLAFNHIASHDLQEPLRKVQTFISRIRETNFETLPPRVKDYLSGIERAVLRMREFIDDLLLYSRASKAEKIFETTDLNVLLENSKQELSERIEEENAIIHASPLPTLNVIPYQIQQLFNNILSNSIKYSKPNIAPVINIHTNIVSGKNLPGLNVDNQEQYYKISISDNGIGFAKEHTENIFTLFYRLHNKNEYSGTGVGLAICKIIVENHKGFIIAEGMPNIGSTFSIYLPVSE